MPDTHTRALAAETILYSLFGLLWILVLLPKEGQFVVFTAIVAWWTVKNRQFIRVNKITLCFLAYAGIHLISIIVAVITRDYTFGRIAAALNTCGIWVLAIWITGIISQSGNIDINRIGKYCMINLTILFVIFAITFFCPNIYFFNGLERRLSWTWDLLLSGETTRFIGFFEYPALISFFVLLQFPWAFKYLSDSRHKWSCLVLIPMTLVPVFMTYSRMGILVNSVMIFAALNYYVLKNGLTVKRLLIIYGILFLLALVCVVIKIDEFSALAYKILHVRPGSNSDRMRIYTETINRISETSWIIGAGIKEMNSAGVYPLGSHCTYLGILFKAGILGGICFLAGLVGTVVSAVRETLKSKNIFKVFTIIMLVLIIAFCLLEDIDGSNWLLVIVFTECMVYSR